MNQAGDFSEASYASFARAVSREEKTAPRPSSRGGREKPPGLLILGYGILGGMVLDNLAKLPERYDIHIAGRDIDALRKRSNLTRIVALNADRYPLIADHACDIEDVSRTAELIAGVDPDIVFNASSLLPYWVVAGLKGRAKGLLDEIGHGAWTPTDAVLPYKLMQAVAASGKKPIVVNGSYADALNPALARIGLAPHVGVGNVANPVPALRLAIASVFDCSPRVVRVRFVAHHAVSFTMPTYGHTSGAPCHLSAEVDGVDVTDRLDTAEIFRLVAGKFARVRGLAGQAVTASSATMILRAIAEDWDAPAHAPGPNGRVGGYPVRVGAYGARLDLHPSLTPELAESINEHAQRWDGIESIGPDGTVYFTERAQEVMSDLFGFACRAMPIHDCELWAKELLERYRSFEAVPA